MPGWVEIGVAVFGAGGFLTAVVTGIFLRRNRRAEADVTLGDGYKRLVDELQEDRQLLREELRQSHIDNQALRSEIAASRLEISQLRNELAAVKEDLRLVLAGEQPRANWFG
ncbi:hypothetical protein [Nocardia cyriacigeorgica]|uniref:hypothetical protein n=1 Tax=Nocardia cyriacigeorgica TaxID=135487 RepID=UPI0018960EEA|nr:hypothetical protein [Nocardia cyriacigeorgica]MBF6416981.1 hypothetical protein [Nocardia cyriacigeorgica]